MRFLNVLFALFLLAHGLVHLLYVAQAQRLFQLTPGLTWPDDSWALSRLLGDSAARWIAAVGFVLVAIAFVVAGVALLLGQAWWQPLCIGATVVSSVVVLLMWNGRFERLSDQGLLALLINAAILVLVLGAHWPSVSTV
jgi:uncharacterized membrane protein YkvI